jgi:hypothetical protein
VRAAGRVASVVAGIAVALAACRRADCPPPQTVAEPGAIADAAPTGLWLEWSMAVDEDQLVIRYTAHNDTDQPIYLLDRLLTDEGVDDEAIIVMNAETPGIVAFVRAAIDSPHGHSYFPRPEWESPGARLVEARGSIDGIAYAAWPLRTWPEIPIYDPLRGTVTKGILEISYAIVDGPEELVATPMEDSPVPLLQPGQGAEVHLLVSNIQPLP